MSEKDKHMPLYSSSDIEKYLSGAMSDPEMHALERAALDDPFLADALEGMTIRQSLPGQPPFYEDMAALEQRLANRVSSGEKGRVRLLPLIVRYAAAVILFLGLGATTYYIFFHKRMQTFPLANTEVKAEPQAPATAATPATTPDADNAAAATRPADNTAATMHTPAASATDSTKLALADGIAANKSFRANKLYRLSDTFSISANVAKMPVTTYNFSTTPGTDNRSFYKNKAFSNVAKQPGAPAYYNSSSNGNNALNTTIIPRTSVVPDTIIFKKDSMSYTTTGVVVQGRVESFAKAPEQLVFTGKVINPQNLPLVGATLALKGNRSFVTTTDQNGYFTLKLSKKDSISGVVVNYIGYEQGYMTLDTEGKTGNVIQLKPQSQSLDEVVVVGYGAKRREFRRDDINSLPLPLSQTAVPAEGWPAYKSYLELNKKSPEIDSLIRGYESISFIVNKKGELSSFKVERSLSPAHDSLTIRLIKQGPYWQLLKGKKERARVVLTW